MCCWVTLAFRLACLLGVAGSQKGHTTRGKYRNFPFYQPFTVQYMVPGELVAGYFQGLNWWKGIRIKYVAWEPAELLLLFLFWVMFFV